MFLINKIIKKKQAQKGFTLLEVLIAMAVLTIGILGIGLMHISAINGNAKAREITEFYATSADHFEQLMSRPYDDLNANGTSDEDETDTDGNDYTFTFEKTFENQKGENIQIKTVVTEICGKNTDGNMVDANDNIVTDPANCVLTGTKEVLVTVTKVDATTTPPTEIGTPVTTKYIIPLIDK